MEKLLREKLPGGRFNSVPHVRSKTMGAIKSKGNKTTELKFIAALEDAEILDWERHPNMIGCPDLYFPHYKLAIFLDGCFWHCCPKCGHFPKTNSAYWKAKLERNIARDSEKQQTLTDQGIYVIRFWEHEILTDVEKCISSLNGHISEAIDKLSNSVDFVDF